MITNYVLVASEPSQAKEAYKALQNCKEISEVSPILGFGYDFIAKIVTKNYDEIGCIIINKIKRMPNVVGTKTLTGIMTGTTAESFVRTTKSE